MAHALGYLTRFAWCWLALSAVGIARAQAPGAGPLVRFTVFSAKPIADVAYVARAGAAPQKLVFYPTARSPRYEYRGVMPLRFIEEATGTVVAEAIIPPEIREALLLFSPIEPGTAGKGAQKSTLRYQVAVLDDGAARHGSGGLAIINFSGLALSGTVNKENVTLRAGLNPTLAVARGANVTLRTTFNGRTYQSYAGMVSLKPRQRALLILFPPFYKGSLEVQSRLLIDEVVTAR